MQTGVVSGAVYEFYAARALSGTRPGVNSPATTTAYDTSGSGNNGTLTNFDYDVWPSAVNAIGNPSLTGGTTLAPNWLEDWGTALAPTYSKVTGRDGSTNGAQRIVANAAGSTNKTVALAATSIASYYPGVIGSEFYASVWVYNNSFSGCTPTLQAYGVTSGNAWTLRGSVAITAVTNTWTRFSCTGTIAADEIYVNLYVICQGDISTGDTWDITFDDAQWELGGTLTPYFDGDMNDCSWSGTHEASASTHGDGWIQSGWAGSGTLADPHRLVTDGLDDWVSVPDVSACEGSAWSYEVWVNTSDDAAANRCLITEMASGTAPVTSLFFGVSGTVGIGQWEAGWGDYSGLGSSVALNDGLWHHLVGTGNATTMELYVDGVSQRTGGYVTQLSMTGVNGCMVFGGGLGPYPGSAAVARIYPFALTPAQVAQNYAAGYTPVVARSPLLKQRPPITVEAAGMLARAKRRQDYCELFVDYDFEQWYQAEWDDVCPGINVVRSGSLRFVAAFGSTFSPWQANELWYWLHKGMDTAQTISSVSFEWTAYGSMVWQVYEATLPSTSATWTLLGSGGGSGQYTREAESFTCSAGKRGLALKVGYPSTKQMNTDEWVNISKLRVLCSATEPTVGEALAGVLVETGIATSYYSKTVT